MTRPIHLDTSFLARSVHPDNDEARRLLHWLEEGRAVSISAMAWAEFLCGPLGELSAAAAASMLGDPLPILPRHAEMAARLFNVTGRRRSSLPDCLIAAVAIDASASLATADSGFDRFAEAGLQRA